MEVCAAQKMAWTRNGSKGRGGLWGTATGPDPNCLKEGGAAWNCSSRVMPSRSFRSGTHLQDGGLDPATGQEGLHLRQAEVADADGPHQPGVNQRLHR